MESNSVDNSSEYTANNHSSVEQAIDDKNKAEASVYMHLFHRSSTILGYSVYLSLAVCLVLSLVSIPDVASLQYDNHLPKVDNWKEYFLYAFFFWICFGLAWTSAVYSIFVKGLRSYGKKIGFFILRNFIMYLVALILIYVIFLALLNYAGMDPITMDILLMVLSAGCAFGFIVVGDFFIIVDYYDAKQKQEKESAVEKNKSINSRMTYVLVWLFKFVIYVLIPLFYIYAMVNIYRISDSLEKTVICLIIHPLFVELYVTYFRISTQKDDLDQVHPFYSHFMPFVMDSALNLFRRFLFNDANNASLVLCFTLASGLQEIISRNYMEYKEYLLCKLLKIDFPNNEESTIRRRKFYAYSVTARSIQEITAIIVSPMMLIFFWSNRYAIDLGYNGDKPIDVQTMLTGTLLQLVVELLVIYVCSVLEVGKKIPMSDFFFQYRTPYIFLIHLCYFLFSCFWVLHSFRTTPNSILCGDANDICSCTSFQVYLSRCQEIKSNSTLVSLTVQQPSPLASLFDSIPAIILSILGIVSIIGLSVYFFYKSKATDQDKTIRRQSEKLKTLLDVATSNLMEKSSLQRAISTIESLCRGVSPSQAKLLQNIIEILKNQSKVNNNVDVNGILTGSSDDPLVRNWLRDQLMNHDDIEHNRTTFRGVNAISRNSNSNSSRLSILIPMDMKKARNSISMGTNNGLALLLGNNNNNSDVSIIKKTDEISKYNGEKGADVANIESSEMFSINGILDADGDEAIDFLTWDFNVFSIKNKNPQSWLAWKCLTKMNIIKDLNLPKLQLSNMLLFVEQHYTLVNYDSFSAYNESSDSLLVKPEDIPSERSNQYHNNLHGADVFQAVLYFSTTYDDIGGSFSSFDLFSVLFAAYIHDFNHPGLNTTYMLSDWPSSGISSTFGSDSPLERHHLAMAFNLMRNIEEFNFLSSYKLLDLDYFRKTVTECVLATDLAKSMPWLSTSRITVKDMLKEMENPIVAFGNGSEDGNRKGKDMEYKILKMQLIIKCADVGHPARILEQHLEWSSRIRDEFYSQGDKERIKRFKISPLCDRNVPLSNYPQGQIGFINYVSKPCFMLLNELLSLSVLKEEEKPWLMHMNNNIQYWEKKKKEFNNMNTAV